MFPTSPSRPRKRGFTLLELIVVIVILGVLAALALPTFDAVIDRSRNATAEATVAAVLRDAMALAAFEERTLPTPEEVATAFSEVSAAAPGTQAIAAGNYTVCDADAGDYATCVSGATGTLVRYQENGTAVGVLVESATPVLGNVSGGRASSWTQDSPTLAAALAGQVTTPGTAWSAASGGGPVLVAAGNTVTVYVNDSDGVGAFLVMSETLSKAQICSSVDREVLSGTGILSNCPGDGGNPVFEDVDYVEAPPAIACVGAPCVVRFTAPAAIGVLAFPLAGVQEGGATSMGGTYTTS